ncbi:MAG: hypothetical protein ACOC5R_05915 [Elusimicrobiota bacterium]
MFKTSRSHKEFQRFIQKKLNEYFSNHYFYRTVYENADIIYKVFITDLTYVRKILLPTYNPRGETPWDPVCLFRTYWLMIQYGYSGSIVSWVKKLKSEPFWAILSGFHPGDIPGISTFYDFEDRLCDFDKGQRGERTNKMHKTKSKPTDKLKKNQKKQPKHPRIVERMVKRILRDEDIPQPERPDDILNLIFKESFVMPSAHKGLLGDTQNLAVSGDGMVFATGGSPYGIKDCDCWEKKGIITCNCPRRFSDPSANWGWDSYREIYVYGHSNYTFTAADSPHDLPIFSSLAQASRHDGVTHTYALYRMKLLYPEFNLSADILDSAHDNYATYELLDHWNIEPFIVLNERNKGNFKYEPPIKVTDEGIPICKGGFEMANWGPDPKLKRHKWRCPHVCRQSCNCPLFNCSDSDYGRTIHTKPEWDKRIFTPTPRGTRSWKNTMKKRTSSERRNSQIREHYDLEADTVRSKSRWFIRIVMRDAAIHTDAWVKTAEINPKEWVSSWFNYQEKAA